MFKILAITLTLFLSVSLPHVQGWTAPDFSRSEITVSPESPHEGEVVTFHVTLRNTGNEASDSAHLGVEWPRMGFFLDVVGLDGPTIDHDAQKIIQSVALPPGAERRFDIRVLAPRNSYNLILALSVSLEDFMKNVRMIEHKQAEILPRADASPRSGVHIGGFHISTVGLVFIGLLVLGFILWRLPGFFTGGQSSRPSAAVFAIMISLGFWAIFASMAWRDYQSLTAWPKTECKILGGRLVEETSGGLNPGRPPKRTTSKKPVLGLRYDVKGVETFSSGFDTGSRLGVGGLVGDKEFLKTLTRGATVPCWYNPQDPTDVVVLNGFGGAYLFALIPIVPFLFGCVQYRNLMRGKNGKG